jgi:chemotaxis protein methyltransferase CheR
MKDSQCVDFLQWALPRLHMRWPGFRKVRGTVCKRIDRRIAELGLADVRSYRDYLEHQPAEWPTLDSFCRIPISRFYRDRSVFDLLASEILPALATAARSSGALKLRCWSAGCASGEEAYTLAILWKLRLHPQFPDLKLDIVATDSDRTMLGRASRACYLPSSLKDLPQAWIDIAFLRADDLLCVKPEFRAFVRFELQDIRRDMPPGPFDLVLCRHLAFTYFDEPLQQDVLRCILDRLTPGGILVTGKQEPLPALPTELEEYQPRTGIYQKRAVPSPETAVRAEP